MFPVHLRILVTRMKKDTFFALLQPLEPKLFGYAYRMLRSEDATRDAMQELMLRMWKKRKELDKHQNISAYCYRTMHNICIDSIRHNKRYVNETTLDGEAHLSSRRKLGPHSSTPVYENNHQELIARIKKAISQLPEKQRIIIELHDFQELTYQEISETMNMEINAIRVNLSRARAKIQSQFKREEIYE